VRWWLAIVSGNPAPARREGFGVKVVFLETVEGSGTRGEVRTVAAGYARNYLLPRGLAAPATPTLLLRAETLAQEEEDRQRSLDEQAQGLVGMLQGQRLVMPVRVGEQGRLYGSVTNGDIAEKAGEILGEELDRRRILLPEAIRQVGVYTVPVRLSRNVTAEAEVVVVDVEAPEGVDAAADAAVALALAAAEAATAAEAVEAPEAVGAAVEPEPGNELPEAADAEASAAAGAPEGSGAEAPSGSAPPAGPTPGDDAPDDGTDDVVAAAVEAAEPEEPETGT
jgi:large subunit ribosomal protein L9